MAYLRFKVYEIELKNGGKGKLHISEDSNLVDILSKQQFLKDMFSEKYIRSDAIIQFRHVGFEEH